MTRIYEWIHTSAPQTLEGSGYGVVARTRDIPVALEKFLRGRSRYDFLKPDLPERGFPVYAHALFRDGRTEWHVLSRMLPCGIDYTGREVFLAHHIAVAADQFAGQSVIRWLLRTDLFRDTWTAAPQMLDPREVPADIRVSLPHGEWRNASRGKAGPECLRMFRQTRKPPLFLLADSGESNFHLLSEALLELPPAEHNRISFVSATLSAQQDVQYDWIGLVRGTTFCDEQLRTSSPRVLDLLDARKLDDLQRAPQPAAPSTPQAHQTTRSGAALFGDPAESDIPWREDQWKPRPPITPGAAPMYSHLPPVPVAPAESRSSGGRTLMIFLSVLLVLAVAGGATVGLRLQTKVRDLSEKLMVADQNVKQLKQTEQELRDEQQKIADSGSSSRTDLQEKIRQLEAQLNSQKTNHEQQSKGIQDELTGIVSERNKQQAAAAAATKKLEELQAAEAALRAQVQEAAEIQTAGRELSGSGIIGIKDDLVKFQKPGVYVLATLPDDFPAGPELSLELLGGEFTGLATKVTVRGPDRGLELGGKAKDSWTGMQLEVAGSELRLLVPEAAAETIAGVCGQLRCCCLRIGSGDRRLLVTMNRRIAVETIQGSSSKAEKDRRQLSESLGELNNQLQSSASADPGRQWTLEWRLGGDTMDAEFRSRSGVLWVIWSRPGQLPLEYPLAFWKP